jgi:hypothetical protein
MAAVGSFWVPFVVAGVVSAGGLAWRLDPRRAPRSLRAMSAMAVLLLTACAMAWSSAATLLHRTPADVMVFHIERVVRRVRQLTPQEDASLPARKPPDTTRGNDVPAECASSFEPDRGDESRQWGASPHSHGGFMTGRLQCPSVAFWTNSASQGGDTYSHSSHSIANAEFDWSCGGRSSQQNNIPPPYYRGPTRVDSQLQLRRSADGRTVEYTCRLTECSPPDLPECAPGIGGETIPGLYLVRRDERRGFLQRRYPPHQRDDAARLAVATVALWAFALLLLRRGAAPLLAVCQSAAERSLPPYRAMNPTANDEPATIVDAHARTVTALLALGVVALVATLVALAGM